MDGQLSIFNFIQSQKPRSLNDYWTADRQGKPFKFYEWELVKIQTEMADQISFWLATDVPKCCGCYPILKQTKHHFQPLSFCECLVCGRKTEPVEDYSWIQSKDRWVRMITNNTKSFQCPCMKVCDVEWCSLKCFLKRGYMRHDGKWIRGQDGKILIANNRECEWIPREN